MHSAARPLSLAHKPTPLVHPPRLAEALGVDLWIKRDDATGGAEAGNKIRKLEFLLADALARGADVILTCGGIQSNHARATTLAARALGLDVVLFLRTADPSVDPLPVGGNVLLERMAGATIRLVSPEQYRARDELLAEAARELERGGRRPYVIPEGGSNGLGALGYVEAMRELERQLSLGLARGAPFDAIVHACGSGGTAAGVALGCALTGVARRVVPVAVCDDADTFEARIAAICDEARALDPRLPRPVSFDVDESARGPAYAETTPEQRERMLLVARLSGLVLDPVYTGKAMSALFDLAPALRGARVLFLHTGGLPGLLAQADGFTAALSEST